MLIPCPACENQVSVQAPICPRCGHPIASGVEGGRLEAAHPPDLASYAAPPGVHQEGAPFPPNNIGISGVDASRSAAEESVPGEATPGQVQEASANLVEAPASGPDAAVPCGTEAVPAPASEARQPDPPVSAPSPAAGIPQRAREIPGSVPAAVTILLLMVVDVAAYLMVEEARQGPRASICGALIVALGLLFGGPGFRTWGVFAFSAGLLLWPLILASGLRGQAVPSDYVSILPNIGIIMLLSGIPSRRRIRAGVGVVVAAMALSFGVGVLEGLHPEWGRSLPTTLPDAEAPPLEGATTHFVLPDQFGGLALDVPAEYPQFYEDPSQATTEKSKYLEASALYTMDPERVFIVAYALTPDGDYDINKGADGVEENARSEHPEFKLLSRKRAKVAGLDSVRLITRIASDPPDYLRYELLRDGRYVYIFGAHASEASDLTTGQVQKMFASIRLGDLPEPTAWEAKGGE